MRHLQRRNRRNRRKPQRPSIEMLASSKKPLYEGAKISQLDAISQLMAVKAKYADDKYCRGAVPFEYVS